MEFVFIFAIRLIQMLLIDILKVVQIIGALWVHTFMYDEMFPVLLWNQGVSTMWAAQLHGRETVFFRGELCVTDFAQALAFGTVIFIEEDFRGAAPGTGTVIRDMAFGTAVYRLDFFTIAFLVVRDEVFVSPLLFEISYEREFINFELLVFGGVGIIKSPLFERDVSADKI